MIKLQKIILILISLFMTIIISGCSMEGGTSNLDNPLHVEKYKDELYFLDSNKAIKVYEKGKIYEFTLWIPAEFRKANIIEDFKVIAPSKFVILTYNLNNSQKNENRLYVIDTENKNIKKIYTSEDEIRGIDIDLKNNLYLSFGKKVLKITLEGVEEMVVNMNELAADQQGESFNELLVGKYNHIFVRVSKYDSSSIILEFNSDGKVVNILNPFKDNYAFSMLTYEDYSILISKNGKLYNYHPGTDSLLKIFDMAIGDIHHWLVLDLVDVNNKEYILLVTDSDTGNFVRVWKLLKDGTPIGNFISTKVTR